MVSNPISLRLTIFFRVNSSMMEKTSIMRRQTRRRSTKRRRSTRETKSCLIWTMMITCSFKIISTRARRNSPNSNPIKCLPTAFTIQMLQLHLVNLVSKMMAIMICSQMGIRMDSLSRMKQALIDLDTIAFSKSKMSMPIIGRLTMISGITS